jgi:hypothetical protein
MPAVTEAGVRAPRPPLRQRAQALRPFVLVIAALGIAALFLGACSSSGPTGAPDTHGTSPAAASGRHKTHSAPPSTSTTTTTTTTVPPQVGWTVLATEPTGVAVDARTFVAPDGTKVRVIRFRAGQFRLDLHVGSEDPPVGSVALPANAQYAIAATEAPSLLAAFNGGFKVTARAGGMEVAGHVLTPLENGLASLVVDSTGRASIGVWGAAGFPADGASVVSVRQNLAPLVVTGAPSPSASTWSVWGATLGGGPYVARSALGEDSSGELLYVASMSTVPIDLADALVSSGAVIGMELDINPEWVQADVAPAPGGTFAVEVPGQNRPSDQYQAGWTRDFVAVLAR